MDDYSALAQRISLNVHEVRGCLLLSRDGLVLGAYPDEVEGVAKSAWLRFCALGEPERSFVEFTDQVWAFVHRGPYGAFAIADVGVRPGILVDQLEQVLMTADEERARRDTLRVPEAPVAPSGKPRTSLHPPPSGRPQPPDERIEAGVSSLPEVSAPGERVGEGAESGTEVGRPSMPPIDRRSGTSRTEALTAAEVAAAAEPGLRNDERGPAPAEVSGHSVEATASHLGKEPMKLVGGAGTPPEEEVEVDRVLLAKEFSGLLQVDMPDDEAQS